MKRIILLGALALFYFVYQPEVIANQLPYREQVIKYATHLADRSEGVDFDGYFGYQCADLITSIAHSYFGLTLEGHAIDFLKSARNSGLQTFSIGEVPVQAGDVFVMKTLHSYGHTGLVVNSHADGTMETVEQNVDGGEDRFSKGGVARYRIRRSDDDSIIGFIRFPFRKKALTLPRKGRIISQSELVIKPKPSLNHSEERRIPSNKLIHYTALIEADEQIWGKARYLGKDGYIKLGRLESDRTFIPNGVIESNDF